MRLTPCLTIISLLQILPNANASKGKYTVIAPDTIYCDEKYTAAVGVHHTIKPCKMEVSIVGLSYVQTKLVEVAQNELNNVEFVFPCGQLGDLNLTAKGIDCLDNFETTTKLIYKKFYNHVIIQTDKHLYAPGDDIIFRVLFLNRDLRPAKPEKDATIWFEDGQRNRIKEIKDFKTIKGVYTGKFKISEYPVAGDWHLGVRNGDEFDRTVHFEVDKYILPKIVVEVEAPKSVSVKDGDMQVAVRANYNYGKPLNGKVNVALFLETDDGYENIKHPILGKTAKMINGKAKLDFNIKGYDAYILPSYMNIVATVEEKFTGAKINGATSTTIFPYLYSMKCINLDASSVDNKKNVLLQITHVDGSYLNDTVSTIQLIYIEFQDRNDGWNREPRFDDGGFVPFSLATRAVVFNGHMNETGFVNFMVALPDLLPYEGYSHYYTLELKYLDERHEVCNSHLYWDKKQVNSPKNIEEASKEYFTLDDKHGTDNKLFSKTPSEFTLNSSQALSYFDYYIIGRGNILKSDRVELTGKPKVYNLILTPQFSWTPIFSLYVSYVDENGEYHFDQQQYGVGFELENQINVTVDKQFRPGEEVALIFKTARNSFVGLMAVSDNGLSFYELNRVLGSYTLFTLLQGSYPTYPGEIWGSVTLTNANNTDIRNKPKNMKCDICLEANKGASTLNNTSGTTDSTYWKAHKDFPKTWFFADIESTNTTEFNFIAKIPETLTSWDLTVFSLNNEKGLGVARTQTKITTILPFFISIELPYSIKRGEVINVPAMVFNYLDKAFNVEVTLENSDDEYDFIEFDNEVINKRILFKNIRVPANKTAAVYFLLKPKVVGNVMLKFTAVSAVASDTIHKSMNVVSKGITQYASFVYLVNLRNESTFESVFELELPEELVPDSEHVELGVIGDILGPVFINLDNLVRLPTRCGEQTMSTLLINYLIIKYLKDAKNLTPTIETKLRYNLETGFQNILSYRHKHGSFSSFDPAKTKEKFPKGSTWLTAYVIRYLQQIKEFIYVDGKIIKKGFAYLNKRQVENGTYTEKGYYYYAPQGNHVTLTCSAVLAIMENPTYAKKYSDGLSKGVDFIARNIGISDSLLTQAIGTFILNKAKHSTAQNEIYKLKKLAKTESDRMWWSAEGYNVLSSDVEITSYALLTLLDQHSTEIDDVLPIFNWLIAQRNSYGGFSSTQATVVGLTALIEFIKFANYKAAKMIVDIETKDKKESIELTKENRILYHSIEVPPKTKSINFTAKGNGSALIQIAYQYNVVEDESFPSFIIKISKMSNRNVPLRLHICVYYVGEGDFSHMALLEISTPSGYVIDHQCLKKINKSKGVRSTELKYSDTLLVVYFGYLRKITATCFRVQAFRTHAVTMQKPASIVLYDHYDTSRKITVFYEVGSKLCDICEIKIDCPKCKQGMVL